MLEAERYASAPLPEHTLSFPLPEAAGEIDAETAGRMLRLLAAFDQPARPAMANQPVPQGGSR